MKLNDFKKLQSIQPDPSYSAKAKTHILSHTPEEPFAHRFIFAGLFRSRTRLAIAGITLFILLGGFSAWKFLTPFSPASLDPAGLRAEAQAIDIQIQLTNINSSSGNALESTQAFVVQPKAPAPKKPAAVPKKSQSAATSTPLGIDDALDILSQ